MKKVFYVDKGIYEKGYILDLLDLIKNKDVDEDYINDYNEIINNNDGQTELFLELLKGKNVLIKPIDFKKGLLDDDRFITLDKDVAYDLFKVKSVLVDQEGLFSYKEIKDELLNNYYQYKNACDYGVKNNESLDLAILYGFNVKR